MARRLLVLAALALAAHAASATSVEDCRARHAAERKTALERWRGDRANANKYPTYCEHPHHAGVPGELPSAVMPPDLSGVGIGALGSETPQPPAAVPAPALP